MEIITGYRGIGHITSAQDGARNAMVMCKEDKVVLMGVGDSLEAEIASATTISIGSGYAINQGRMMGIDINDSETLTIASGTAGSKRADIIAIRYTKDSETGVENAQLVVIQGTSGATYVDPEYNDNDILNEGAAIDDFPLYRVKLNGVNIDSIEPMFKRWELDTGWRTDLVEINFNLFSGPTSIHQPAIRVIGNQVFFRGGVYYDGSVSQVDDPNYQIPSEYAPSSNMKWTSVAEAMGQGSAITVLEHTLDSTGKISLEYNIHAISGSTTPASLDTSYISWFID